MFRMMFLNGLIKTLYKNTNEQQTSITPIWIRFLFHLNTIIMTKASLRIRNTQKSKIHNPFGFISTNNAFRLVSFSILKHGRKEVIMRRKLKIVRNIIETMLEYRSRKDIQGVV
mmetsp:Transcript_1619/g.1435  ORF Transcript_1619/g.1435 Transcript_1619/m.1435 type:complete len:114 (-) Transcript_1619:1202-1543(-)